MVNSSKSSEHLSSPYVTPNRMSDSTTSPNDRGNEADSNESDMSTTTPTREEDTNNNLPNDVNDQSNHSDTFSSSDISEIDHEGYLGLNFYRFSSLMRASTWEDNDSIVPILPPVGYQPLDFRPTLLKPWCLLCVMILYLCIGCGIAVLWYYSRGTQQYQVSNENVQLIARYAPGLTATATTLLFRQTIRDTIRMKPYIAMADQNNILSHGASPRKSIAGAYFPFVNIFITPNSPMFLFLFVGNTIVGFLIAAKTILISVARDDMNWILTVRSGPAYFLIAGYVLMAATNLVIMISLWSKSTGLRWDPVSIVDFVSLFAKSNALDVFSDLEYGNGRDLAHKILSGRLRFRIGYWKHEVKDQSGKSQTEIFYGIGATGGYFKSTPKKVLCITKDEELPTSPDSDDDYLLSTGAREQWSCRKEISRSFNDSAPEKWFKNPTPKVCNGCDHYPYRYSVWLGSWGIIFWMVVVYLSLSICGYALTSRTVWTGFSISPWFQLSHSSNSTNTTQLSGINQTIATNHTVGGDDPIWDLPQDTVVYALVFRAIPTQLASYLGLGFIPSIDTHLRFMQPFRGMFQHPGFASESISLAYLTASSIEIPGQAYALGHYQVAWFSILANISSLFPIFVSGIMTITVTKLRIYFEFASTGFITSTVFLVVFCISLPFAWPTYERSLPRYAYSLADLMGMCYQSQFLADPILNIASPRVTRDKLAARVLLRDQKYLFGWYLGRDGNRHLGFDVAEDEMGPLNNVRWIAPSAAEKWKPNLNAEEKKPSLIRRIFRKGIPREKPNDEEYQLLPISNIKTIGDHQETQGLDRSENDQHLMHGAIPVDTESIEAAENTPGRRHQTW